MKKERFFFLIIFILSFKAFANNFDVRNYNVREGLVQSQVFDITQDREGYLWFATAGGVSRFDGQEFKNFTKRQGLAENFTTAILLDRHGNLWFAHQKGKLSKLNPKTLSIKTYQISIEDKPQTSFQIYSMFEDSTGRIWFITVGNGLYFYQNGQFYKLGRRQGLLSSYVYKILQYNDSTLWVATARGLSTINCRDSIPQKSDSLQILGLKKPYLVDMLRDHQGNIWFSVLDEGLFCLYPNGSYQKLSKKDGLLDNNIWNIAAYKNGLLISYNNRGVSYIKLEPNKDENFAAKNFYLIKNLTSQDIFRIFVDRECNIWFGLNGKGVDRLSESLIETYRLSDTDATKNIVWSILGKGDEYWLGLENGLAYFNVSTRKTKFINKIGEKNLINVMQIFPDNQGGLWILSFGSGIFRYDSKKKKFYEFKVPKNLKIDTRLAFCMEKSDDGKYWFGFEEYGILIFDPRNNKFEHLTRKKNNALSDSIFVLYNDGKGSLWIGTYDDGLIKYDGSKFIKYGTKTGYSIDGVNDITTGPEGKLWMISSNDEILTFDGQKIDTLTEKFGLTQNSLFTLQFWKNQLWVGTNRGLVCIDLTTGGKFDVGINSGFDVSETNERASFISSDSTLWFGTINGVVRVKPKILKHFIITPIVKLNNVLVFSHSFKWPDDNRLSYNKNHLTFNFSGIYFKVPEWLKFQYKLKGFDQEWSPPTESRTAQYSYIPPGEYTFQVRASIDCKTWSTPVELHFIITPPFYQTWWFLFLSALFIVTAIFGVIYYRDVQNRKTKMYLEQKVHERTVELLNEKERVEAINKALTESESKFRTLTEISPSAVFIYQDYKFVYVNPATERITGYSKEELLNKHITTIVHPDFKNLIADRAKKRMSGKQVPDRYEFKILRKDGEERWIDFSARAITYIGKEAGLGTVFDITERKRAEEALLQEKERLSAILSAIADGVIATDRDQNIILCNIRALSLLGISNKNQNKYVGKKFSELVRLAKEDAKEQIFNPVKELIDSDGATQIEGTGFLLVKHKKKILVEFSAAPIFDKESHIMGVVFAIRDITDRRRMEKELLKNQKLESIGVLAGGIAHDFNNFLTAIMGNLSLLRMRVDENDKRLINRILSAEKAAEKAQELTQQLLTFSKGGLPIKKHTNIYELVKDSAEFVLSGSNVDFVLESESDLWNAEVDPGQINQVIQNLIINADQAMPNGGTIFIKLENTEIDSESKLPLNPGKYIKLRIKDHGVGIPQKYLPKIFDPFFTTKQSGSGLGLATSFSIIQKHNGHIEVSSVVGEGTEFTIYLPATIINQKQKVNEVKFKKFNTGPKKPVVLVMDDEEMVRDLAANLFEQLGFVVVQAKDGQEAINLYQAFLNDRKKIDLVIMDLTIPGGMGGKEAIQKLLQIDPQAIAIVSSGYSNDPVMAEFDKYGFKACLRKPFKIEELSQILNDILNP